MKPQSTTFLWGIFLLCLGGLFLLNSFGLLNTDEGTGTAMVFFAGGIVFLAAYFVFKKKLWTLILGCIGIFIGFATYIEATGFLPGEFSGIALFVITGLVFLGSLRRGLKNWWAIIPGGFCFIIAGHIGLDLFVRHAGNLHAVLLFGGIGLIFGILYFLKNETHQLGWAKYPALGSLGLCALIFFTSNFEDVLSEFFLPFLLVSIGVIMLIKSLRAPHADMSDDFKNDDVLSEANISDETKVD